MNTAPAKQEHLISDWAPELARHELTWEDPAYPRNFLEIDTPPKRLFLLGDSTLLNRPMLAIVGARKATPSGLRAARRFARLAALQGIAVVSGGAVGCDQAAHQGALEAGGTTLVVLGCGADIVYPAGAQALFTQILEEGGTLISEAPWGSAPLRWAFRRRNRLIAGLAQATLIVEAGLPSGTFGTADATLAQGKEVLAVPGSIFAQESRGANRLIAQGAWPIIDDASFEGALAGIFGPPLVGSIPSRDKDEPPPSSYPSNPVLAVLSQQPSTPEDLVGICGDDVVEVIRYLTSMELSGQVERLRDGRYACGNPQKQRY